MRMHDKCKIRTKATNSASALEFSQYIYKCYSLFFFAQKKKYEKRQVTLVYNFFLSMCLSFIPFFAVGEIIHEN